MSAFTPVKPKRVYAQIVEQIIELIKSGEFSAGRQLPTERELSRRLGVGRASVREALSALQILGLVETKHGQGTFVCATQPSPALQSDTSLIYSEESPFAILLARMTIEPPIAAIAATARPDSALHRLENILDRMESQPSDIYVFSSGDRDFHLAIGEATGNSVLGGVMSQVCELMGQRLWLALMTSTSFAVRGRVRQGLDEHRGILEAIKLQDAKLAAERMDKHLHRVEQVMIEAELGDKNEENDVAANAEQEA
jgi:GntR family transcriptional repressor for pyruvate dehydrogenase complex